eukprot:11653303-Alexandrium_andersonii.AAC.1
MPLLFLVQNRWGIAVRHPSNDFCQVVAQALGEALRPFEVLACGESVLCKSLWSLCQSGPAVVALFRGWGRSSPKYL